MANVNDVFDDVTGKQSFYVPGKDNKKKTGKFVPYAKGEYFCHIIESESKVLDVKGGQYKAELFTYTVEVAPENAQNSYQYRSEPGGMVDTDGSPYIGRKFRGKLWRFLEPSKGDTFESNSTGNTQYMRFCDTIGGECETDKKEVNGEVMEVKLLPKLSAEDMVGKAVIAVVDKGRPWTDKEGNQKQYWDCKFCKTWDGGKDKEISQGAGDEIPF